MEIPTKLKKKWEKEERIAIMERDTPELLKKLDLGEVRVEVKTNYIKKLFSKKETGKYIKVSSDVLYKLEEEAHKFLEKGHEILKSVFIGDGGYCVIFSYEKNPNSFHLRLKKSCEKLKESREKILKSEARKK